MPNWVWFLLGFIAGELALTLVLFALQRVIFVARGVVVSSAASADVERWQRQGGGRES